MQLVKEFFYMFIREIRSKNRLYKGGIGLDSILLAGFDGQKSLLDGSCVGLQYIPELGRHDRYTRVELHLVFQLYEEIKNRLALVFAHKMLKTCFGRDEQSRV